MHTRLYLCLLFHQQLNFVSYRKITSKIEIWRGIHKNRNFYVFSNQNTRFFFPNLNPRQPTQQTRMLELPLPPENFEIQITRT